MRSCARCPSPVRAEGQRLCPDCHAAAQRDHRERKRQEVNEYHAARSRAKKVRAIVDLITDRLIESDLHEPGCTTLLEGMRASDQSIRDAVAREAGQRSPSETAWALVVEGVRERIAWLARGAAMSRKPRRVA